MQDRHSLPPLEDDFARALLRSADVDEPPRAAYAKVAAALGLGTVLGVGASLPAPTALIAGASSASTWARWSGTLAGKLTLVVVSGALLLGAGATLLRPRPASRVARNAQRIRTGKIKAARVVQNGLVTVLANRLQNGLYDGFGLVACRRQAGIKNGLQKSCRMGSGIKSVHNL